MATRRRSWGTIRQLPSKHWRAEYTGPDLKIHKAPVTFAAKIDAEGWLITEKRLIDADTWTSPTQRTSDNLRRAEAAEREAVTLSAYATDWLRRGGSRGNAKPRTLDAYRYHLTYIEPVLGDTPLAELTEADVRDWYAGLPKDKATLRARCYGTLAAILNSAVKDKGVPISESPARIAGAGSVERERVIEPLTPVEIAALAAALPEELRLTVLLAGWLGLRWGEVFALRRRDVSADGSKVHVRRSLNYRGAAGYSFVTPKAESAGTVTVPPHLRDVLTCHLSEHTAASRDALVFARPGGEHWTLSTYRTHYLCAQASSGVEVHFHALRHSAGTLYAMSGATLRESMKHLRHRTPAASLRYQEVAAGRADVLAERLSALAAGEPHRLRAVSD